MSRSASIDREALGARACRPLSATPRPFLKWAGSKRQFLPEIVDVLPDSYRTYYEPFLGSGSLFFLLQPQAARLSDACKELIDTFSAVRDGPSHVLRYLSQLTVNREEFYRIRSGRSKGRYRRAAEFVYLNKACWNGLYRVNSSGEFNVPYGAPRTAKLVDRENLRKCAITLSEPDVSLEASDFASALKSAGAGDLVFLDPPYVTAHNNNGFVDYNERLFGWSDQVRLAESARAAVGRGAYVLVTNAYHDDVIELYEGFSVAPLFRRSTLASDDRARRPVMEALFWSVE